MKLLYLSCHSILEYDELKLFEEMGIEFLSLGSYVDPQHPTDAIRPALNQPRMDWEYRHAPDKKAITKEYADHFDAIMIMHVPEWIYTNWPNIKHKKVIWRTIGQSTPEHEQRLSLYRQEGLQVVRYSPREAKIINYIGGDAIIRFYKDEDQFKGWVGKDNEIITFAQDMKHRGEFCSYEPFLYVTKGFNAHIYGPNNSNSGELNGGLLSYDEMRRKMQDARIYLYTGTQPASYTLAFIEALMTGIPVVALGPKYVNSMQIAGDTYEIPDIIKSGFNGYMCNDLDDARAKLDLLLSDFDLCKKIGEAGRKTAIELFGKENIIKLWKDFLL